MFEKFIFIYTFWFCKFTVWYKKNNNIIMKTQKIIKRIILALFLLQKVELK